MSANRTAAGRSCGIEIEEEEGNMEGGQEARLKYRSRRPERVRYRIPKKQLKYRSQVEDPEQVTVEEAGL
jgi:hypothetical protein